MQFTPPAVNIVTRPTFTAIGQYTSTSMETAQVDCPKIWMDIFGPKLPALQQQFGPIESYGISVVTDLDKGTFDYWAAIALPPNTTVPAGLEILSVPGGLFLEASVPHLAALDATYSYIYNDWFPKQNNCAPAYNAYGYELYPATYTLESPLFIYAPLVKV